MIALFILPVYILANYYIVRWFIKWIGDICKGRLPKAVKVIIHIIYWPLTLAMYIAALVPEGGLRRLLNIVGTYWYGVIIYIILSFAIFDLIRLIIRKIRKLSKHERTSSRVNSITARSLFVALIVIIGIYGAINARTIHTTEYEVDVDKSGGKLGGLNIVLVSDQHMGYSVGTRMMQDMVDKINAYNPDIVIMAGDIFDNNYDALEDPERLIEIYKSIKSKYGVYAVYGNHDVSEEIIAGFTFPSKDKRLSDERMDKFLRDANVINLRDEYVLIDDSFYVYGRPDYAKLGRGIDERKSPEEMTHDLDKNKPIIVIDHQPRQFKELDEAGVDLDLSGHTHDGQIFPLNLTSRLIWDNSRGVLKVGDMTSIVTSGVGFYGPSLRVLTESEVVDIKVNFTK